MEEQAIDHERDSLEHVPLAYWAFFLLDRHTHDSEAITSAGINLDIVMLEFAGFTGKRQRVWHHNLFR